jgi:hypothetical protein
VVARGWLVAQAPAGVGAPAADLPAIMEMTLNPWPQNRTDHRPAAICAATVSTMQHLAFLECPVERCALLVTPGLDFVLRVDQQIESRRQRPQKAAQPDHFGGAVGHGLFDHQQVDVRSGIGISSRL